jgi:NADH-quinone oxidoreductase subunit N|tara:strand:- start:523 stop:1953 length:1431 start_codon:yes stop_codon:yes gene_type:complete
MLFSDLNFIISPLILIFLALTILIIDFYLKNKILLIYLSSLGLAVSSAVLVYQWIFMETGQYVFFETLIFDKFYILFALTLNLVSLVIILAFSDYILRKINFISEFLSLLLLSLIGSTFVIMAVDFVTIYLSLELASLPIIALIAFGRGKFSLEASFKYLILASFSTGIFLFGLVYLYGSTGSLELMNIQISTISPSLIIGLVFLFIGVAFKLSIAPWHMWTPDTYQGSPMPIVTYLSTVSKIAGFALIIRIFMHIFSYEFDKNNIIIFLSVISVISMTIGNFGALIQKDLKRLLAYSTIAHAGYMLIGVVALISTSSAASTTIFYILGYAMSNLTIFFTFQYMINISSSTSIDSLKGMFHQYPLVSIIFSLGILSLLGIPATAGFMGKVLLFGSAINNGLLWLAIIGVINSFVSAYYYLGLLRNMFISTDEVKKSDNNNGINYLFFSLITSAGVLTLGIFPGILLSVLDEVISKL